MADHIDPFEALGDLISGKVFDGPEEKPPTTKKEPAELEEVTDEQQPKQQQRRAKPAPSIDHIFESESEPKPVKRKQPKASERTDAVAAEEAATEGEGKA